MVDTRIFGYVALGCPIFCYMAMGSTSTAALCIFSEYLWVGHEEYNETAAPWKYTTRSKLP